ncbi:MAG: DNA repair protein RadC [Euryarchaeota archaeon]|nr:DNA repair protein RadC [Euryarchaeota archaeon]
MPEEERPRERLRKIGVNYLSIQELLALVIERGTKGKNVLNISQDLLSHFGNLAKIKEASLRELQRVDGIGFATACKLKASLKLGEKALISHKRWGQKIESPRDVFNLLKSDLGNKKREHLKIISLNTKKSIISIDNISVGSLNSSIAHPREIFRSAIQNSAHSVILVHNHPSGDPTPSDDDIELTKRLIKAGNILGIKVVDHVIIAGDSFVNLRGGVNTAGLWE